MTNVNVKGRLLRRIWADNKSISPEEMENIVTSGVITPNDMIIWATIEGREDLVDTLLQKGADPNKRGYNDAVPALFRAVEAYADGTATFSSVALLMKAGANPHHFVEWCDDREWYQGTIAVVAYKAFKINILKVA